MTRVAFVVQRYGLEVNGGAEIECRWIAELMKEVWDVRVLTTCALDYMTWANHFAEGKEEINGVLVHRFPVTKPRDVLAFNKLSDQLFQNTANSKKELAWMEAQGPDCPRLLNYIEAQKDSFDVFFFFTYLYATTFWGLPLVAEKAFLIPTAHDEPPIYLSIFKDFFRRPKGFVFNTPEEKALLTKLFDIDCTFSDIVGLGVDFNPSQLGGDRLESRLPSDFVLYAGRIDESKGCKELFEFWENYKRHSGGSLFLVLIGKSQLDIPKREDVLHLGFVSEKEKYCIMSLAKCLIMPSYFESLSIVILESWLCEKPVIVNARCDVLKGQCSRSNGGLWYRNYDEFEACLDFILKNDTVAEEMARCGKRYASENYNMKKIKGKYLRLVSNFLD